MFIFGVHCLRNNVVYRYQRAFVDFFEDELVAFGYDWKQLTAEYLFSGEQPLINGIIAGRMST